MKRNLLFGLLIWMTLTFLSSCKQDEGTSYENHALNQKSSVGFYYGNDFSSSFIYKPYLFQVAYSSSNGGYLYRLSHALDLRTFQLSNIPTSVTPNMAFDAELHITGFGTTDFQGTAKCVVTQQNGNKLWILDKDHNYGFIIEYK